MAENFLTETSGGLPSQMEKNYSTSNYRTLNTEASSGDLHMSSVYLTTPQNKKIFSSATNLQPSSIQTMLSKDPVVYRFELDKEKKTKADINRRFKPSNIRLTKEINEYEETYNTVKIN